MKKNYTSPVVEVKAFDFEDVVMVLSGVDPNPTPTPNPSVGAGSTAISGFTTAVETAGAGIVVEW